MAAGCGYAHLDRGAEEDALEVGELVDDGVHRLGEAGEVGLDRRVVVGRCRGQVGAVLLLEDLLAALPARQRPATRHTQSEPALPPARRTA